MPRRRRRQDQDPDDRISRARQALEERRRTRDSEAGADTATAVEEREEPDVLDRVLDVVEAVPADRVLSRAQNRPETDEERVQEASRGPQAPQEPSERVQRARERLEALSRERASIVLDRGQPAAEEPARPAIEVDLPTDRAERVAQAEPIAERMHRENRWSPQALEQNRRWREELWRDLDPDVTTGQKIVGAARNFAGGIAQIPGGTLEGIGLLAKELDDMMGMRTDTPVNEYVTFRIGSRLREWAEEAFPKDPDLAGTFLYDVLPSGFGSVYGFMGTALAPRLVRGITRAAIGRGAPRATAEALAKTANESRLNAVRRMLRTGQADDIVKAELAEGTEALGGLRRLARGESIERLATAGATGALVETSAIYDEAINTLPPEQQLARDRYMAVIDELGPEQESAEAVYQGVVDRINRDAVEVGRWLESQGGRENAEAVAEANRRLAALDAEQESARQVYNVSIDRMVERARTAEATYEELMAELGPEHEAAAREVALWGLPIGALEAVPIEMQLGRLLGVGRGAGVLRTATPNVFEEAMQEGSQAFLENLVASTSYDPDRPLGEGVGVGLAVGAITGGGTSVLHGSVANRLRSGAPPAADDVAEELEAERAAPIELTHLGAIAPSGVISRSMRPGARPSFAPVGEVLAADDETRAPAEVLAAIAGEPPAPVAPGPPPPESPLARWSRLGHEPTPAAVEQLGNDVPQFEHAAEFIYNLAGLTDTLQEAIETGEIPDEQLEQAERSLGRWWERLEGSLREYSQVFGTDARRELELALVEELAGGPVAEQPPEGGIPPEEPPEVPASPLEGTNAAEWTPEQSDLAREELRALQRDIVARYPDVTGIEAFVSNQEEMPGYLELASLYVDPEAQGQGTGTAVMNELVGFADRYGMTAWLQLGSEDPDVGTTSQERLRDFYERFGFEDVPAGHPVLPPEADMYRPASGESEMIGEVFAPPTEEPTDGQEAGPATAPTEAPQEGVLTPEGPAEGTMPEDLRSSINLLAQERQARRAALTPGTPVTVPDRNQAGEDVQLEGEVVGAADFGNQGIRVQVRVPLEAIDPRSPAGVTGERWYDLYQVQQRGPIPEGVEPITPQRQQLATPVQPQVLRPEPVPEDVPPAEAGVRRREEADPERAELLRQLYEDEQTGLQNRRSWERARERVESESDTRIVALDIRGLKALNDLVGHEAGDRMIEKVGIALQDTAARLEVDPRNIWRIGGDEFVAAVPADQAEEFQQLVQGRIPEETVPGSDIPSGIRTAVGDTYAEADRQLLRARDAEPGPRYREARSPADAPIPGARQHGDIWLVPPSALATDPERFQYKIDARYEGGVTEALRDVTHWNEDLAGVIAVWKDPDDDQTYVVNGHHRQRLAELLEVEEIAVRFLDAPTAQAARVSGALMNIGEGNGTALAAAKLMRDAGLTEEDFQEHGISLTGAVARDGAALSKLHEGIFTQVVNGDMPIQRATIIGASGFNHDDQWQLFTMLRAREERGRRLTNDEVIELIRFSQSAPRTEEVEINLFGTETIDRALAVEKARVSARIRSRFVADRRLFGYLTRAQRAERLEEMGVGQVDVERAAEIALDAEQAGELYDRLSTRSGAIADLLNEGAQSLADGEDLHAVEERLYERIQSALHEALEGGEGLGVLESPASPYQRTPTDERVWRSVREEGPLYAQDDLFGGEARLSGPQQNELFGQAELVPGTSISEVEERARGVVERLRPLVEADAASDEEQAAYLEALSFLRRAEAMDAEEVRLRNRRNGLLRPNGQPEVADDTGDLFEAGERGADYIERVMADNDRRRELLEEVIPAGITLELSTPVALLDRDRWIRVVSRSPGTEGLRVTSFDREGPIGHILFPDRAAVIDHLVLQTRTEGDRAEQLLEEWARDPTFAVHVRHLGTDMRRQTRKYVRETPQLGMAFSFGDPTSSISVDELLDRWATQRQELNQTHPTDFYDLLIANQRPWYYSRLREAIEGSPIELGTPEQWLGWLRKQPVSQKEIDWVDFPGILQGLQMDETARFYERETIPKQDILDRLDTDSIRLTTQLNEATETTSAGVRSLPPSMWKVRRLADLVRQWGDPDEGGPPPGQLSWRHVVYTPNGGTYVPAGSSPRDERAMEAVVARMYQLMLSKEAWDTLPDLGRRYLERKSVEWATIDMAAEGETVEQMRRRHQVYVEEDAQAWVARYQEVGGPAVDAFKERANEWVREVDRVLRQAQAWNEARRLKRQLQMFGWGAETHRFGSPQYKRYSLRGGSNYREFGIQLNTGNAMRHALYSAPHFGFRENLIAHFRTKDRELPIPTKDGGFDRKRILHIDEIQSDWSTAYRRQEKFGQPTQENVDELRKLGNEAHDEVQEILEDVGIVDLIVEMQVQEINASEYYEWEGKRRGRTQGDIFDVDPPTPHTADSIDRSRLPLSIEKGELSIDYIVKVLDYAAEHEWDIGGTALNLTGYTRREELALAWSQARTRQLEGNYFHTAANAMERSLERLASAEPGDAPVEVPAQPWLAAEDWTGLVVRRAITQAVREGYDGIAWASGELSQQLFEVSSAGITHISLRPVDDYLEVEAMDGRGAAQLTRFVDRQEALSEIVGSEMATTLWQRFNNPTARELRFVPWREALNFASEGPSQRVLKAIEHNSGGREDFLVAVVGDFTKERDPEAFVLKRTDASPAIGRHGADYISVRIDPSILESTKNKMEQNRAAWQQTAILTGSDLVVGGQWQLELYNKIVPKVVRNELKWLLGKKHGLSVSRRIFPDMQEVPQDRVGRKPYEVRLLEEGTQVADMMQMVQTAPEDLQRTEDDLLVVGPTFLGQVPAGVPVGYVERQEEALELANEVRKENPRHDVLVLHPTVAQDKQDASWYLEFNDELRGAVLEKRFRVLEAEETYGADAWRRDPAGELVARRPAQKMPRIGEAEADELTNEQLELAFGGPAKAKDLSTRLAEILGNRAHMVVDGVYSAEARAEVLREAEKAQAWVDLRGQKLDPTNPQSTIELLEHTRSPAAETLVFLGLDAENRVTSQVAHSSGAINYVAMSIEGIAKSLEYLRALGSTRFIISHNHPSGDSRPSPEDIGFAAELAKVGRAAGMPLEAAVVINHGEAHVWIPEGAPQGDVELIVGESSNEQLRNGYVYRYQVDRTGQVDWTVMGKAGASTPGQVVNTLAAATDPRGFSVAWLSAQHKIVSVSMHHESAIDHLPTWFTEQYEAQKAGAAIFYIGHEAPDAVYKYLVHQVNAHGLAWGRSNGVLDVIQGRSAGAFRGARNEEALVDVPAPMDTADRSARIVDIREPEGDYDASVTTQDLRVWKWIQEFFEQVGLPMDLDRYKVLQRRTMGAYWSWGEYSLLKDPHRIETAAHEVGHHIHKLFFGLYQRGLSGRVLAPWSNELIGITRAQAFSKSRQTRKEGLAEFFDLYVTDPKRARELAPNFYDYADRRLREEFIVVHDALLELRDRYRVWKNAPDEAKADARIAEKQNPFQKLRDRVRDGWKRKRLEVLDDLFYIEQISEEFDESGMLEIMARTSRGAAGAGETMLSIGMLDFNTLEIIGPGLDEIMDAVAADRKEYVKFRRWATAIRALELSQYGIETGFDLAAQQRIVEKYDSELYRDTWAKIQKWNEGLLQYIVDAGVISQELMDRLREKHPNYLPFFRAGFDESEAMKIGGRQFAHLFSPIKKIKGSYREIIDPFESLARLAYTYTSVAARQEVNRQLIAVGDQEGTGGWIRPIPTPTRVTRVQKGEVIDFIMGSIMQQEDPNAEGLELGDDVLDALEEIMLVFRPGHWFGNENIISRLDPETGKREWYWVNDEVYEGVQGSKGAHTAAWIRLASRPSRWLRAGATGTPDFAVRNLFRDQGWASILSDNVHIPWVHATTGFVERFRHFRGEESLVPQMKAAGGEFANLIDMDRQWIRDTTQAMVRDGVPNVVTNPIQLFWAISRGTENLTRTGEFRAVVERLRNEGVTGRELYQRAAMASRGGASPDYLRKGSAATIQAIRQIATFWSANLVSWDQLYRGLTDTRKVPGTNLRKWQLTTMKALAWITAPSLLLWLINHDDPDYQEMPRWQRDLFWLIKIPRGWVDVAPDFLTADVGDTGAGRAALDRLALRRLQPFAETGHEDYVWLRIPKPFQLGIMFSSIPERILDWAVDQDGQGVREAVTYFVGIDPTLERKGLGQRIQDFWSSDVGTLVIPDVQVVMPFVENFGNYSRFLERPIVSRSRERLEPWLQHSEYTSEVAKALGRTLNYSPAKIENLIQSWTGGMGQYGLDFAEWAGGMAGVIPQQDRPSRGYPNMPFLRSFFANPAGFTSATTERFYAEWELSQRAYNTYLSNRRTGHPLTEWHYDANESRILNYRWLESRRQVMNELRDRADVIAEDTSLSRRQRQALIDELGQEYIQVAQEALDSQPDGGLVPAPPGINANGIIPPAF